MAYRRTVLEGTGGFDERFPRPFREDADLALRTVRAGFDIVWGERRTVHPVRSRGGWRGSIAVQAGNADNALHAGEVRARLAATRSAPGPGRTGRHLLTVTAAAAAAAAAIGRPAPAGGRGGPRLGGRDGRVRRSGGSGPDRGPRPRSPP